MVSFRFLCAIEKVARIEKKLASTKVGKNASRREVGSSPEANATTDHGAKIIRQQTAKILRYLKVFVFRDCSLSMCCPR